MPGGDDALEQVETITGQRTPFLAKIAEYRAAIANALDGKTAYEYEQDTHHFAAMFPGLTVEAFARQHVQDFINRRMIDQRRPGRLSANKSAASEATGTILSHSTNYCVSDNHLPISSGLHQSPLVANRPIRIFI